MQDRRHVWVWEYTTSDSDWSAGDDSFTTKKVATYSLSSEKSWWREVTRDKTANVRITKYVPEAEINAG